MTSLQSILGRSIASVEDGIKRVDTVLGDTTIKVYRVAPNHIRVDLVTRKPSNAT